jgi:hypothetical protein
MRYVIIVGDWHTTVSVTDSTNKQESSTEAEHVNNVISRLEAWTHVLHGFPKLQHTHHPFQVHILDQEVVM